MRHLVAALLAAGLAAGCGANAPTYASCEDDLDCSDPNDSCHRLLFDRSDGTSAAGNLCSRPCEEDLDCPLDAVCLALAGDPTATRFCAQRCDAAADCYADFACTEVAAMDLSLCLP